MDANFRPQTKTPANPHFWDSTRNTGCRGSRAAAIVFWGAKVPASGLAYAYTPGSAYAEFEEKTKGILAPGYLADFVILDRDITKISPKEILGTRVLRISSTAL
ncbi:MAG TPA: amidohydrolase family protein [Terriglobales bacterium]|nr:amidohydrolase family protein [Terriglobales bacterium]